MSQRLPSYFIPHGGGPCFFMDWPDDPRLWDAMGNFLRGLGDDVGSRPKAVVVISGHWLEPAFTVNAGARPPLLYDYYGFPPHTYQLQYPAPGDPALAQRIVGLLEAAGLPTAVDTTRGLDHGVFIPFKLIYPQADIPIVQLSLQRELDSELHLRAGRALAALRDEGVLIVGSGMSFHNMRGYHAAFNAASHRFDDWLSHAVGLPRAGREEALRHWQQAPHAREVQPDPDHLLPLMVAAGAAGEDAGKTVFSGEIMDVVVSGHRFG